MKNLRKGDLIKCVNGGGNLRPDGSLYLGEDCVVKGRIYTFDEFYSDNAKNLYRVKELPNVSFCDWRFELHEQRFEPGDKLRCLDASENEGHLIAGQEYEFDKYTWDVWGKVEFVMVKGDSWWFNRERFERIEPQETKVERIEPQETKVEPREFKVGDKVRCIKGSNHVDGLSVGVDCWKAGEVGTITDIRSVYLHCEVDGRERTGFNKNFELVKEEAKLSPGDVVSVDGKVVGTVQNPNQAMRANNGKPKLSYLLTFVGNFKDTETEDLARWYRGEEGATIKKAVDEILESLTADWPELMCRVCVFGEKKYARGNYLKGQPWSDTCDSLLRHLKARAEGQEVDPESGISHIGHIAWNCCFLEHCVNTMPHFDDRVRAPK